MAKIGFPVVGIGASAGGVEALSALFHRLSGRLGAAFVVVTHLARKRESLLPEILGRCTAMPVTAAQDGQPLERGRVYLIPPDAVLEIFDGCLVVSPREGDRNPIDIFLCSLAKEVGERAVAVILSGTGTDGALGVKAVHEAGGFTLAQGSNGTGPSHPGMPDSAIATGFVDCVLPVEALADRVAGYVRDLADEEGAVPPEAESDGARLGAAKAALCGALQDSIGHDFSRYKDKTFLRRVGRRMQVRQISELPRYVDLVRSERDEAAALFRDLLIGVTDFFRDGEAFDELASQVVPRLFEGKGAEDMVRVWVPGCATGEEAYSLAILLREAMDGMPAPPRVQIFATDVDENAVAVARVGRYPDKLLERVSPARLGRFFVKEGHSYIVAKEIRELCLFSSHSVIRDPPFSRIDLVSCRNLLIYFNNELQRTVIPLFHYALKPGGILFLGVSEAISQHAELFSQLDKKHRIFQRRDLPARPSLFPLFARTGLDGRLAEIARERVGPSGRDAVRKMESRILERYSPAHLLVNRDWEVVHFSAGTGKFLELPPGPPTRDLLAVARRDLRMALRSARHEALETGRVVQRPRIILEIEGAPHLVSVAAEPIPADDRGETLWMLVFTDHGPAPGGEGSGASERGGDRGTAMTELEQELQNARTSLRCLVEESEASVEELRSANEELLSMNEELQSANEELETSKEEAQSVNEELHTVNHELAIKVDELDHANNDLKNLFDSTRIATLFLDDRLNIRSFTPAVCELFRLLPGDRGRPLADIATSLDYPGLKEDLERTLRSGDPVERKVAGGGDARFLARILPYRTAGHAIDGIVVTFVDVTLIDSEAHQRLLVDELNHRVKNILSVVASITAQMARRCRTVPEFAEGMVGRIHGLAKTHEILAAKEWAGISLAELIGAELHAFVGDVERASLRGPTVFVAARAATTLGIVIHELATNAMKYGALSTPLGRVAIKWGFETDGDARALVLTWRELNGPPVSPPEQKGLGSELIERSLDYELGGSAVVEFRPEGLVARLSMPVTPQLIHREGNVA